MALSCFVFPAAGVEDLLHRPARSDVDLTCVDMCGVFKNDTQFEPTKYDEYASCRQRKVKNPYKFSLFLVGNILEESFVNGSSQSFFLVVLCRWRFRCYYI